MALFEQVEGRADVFRHTSDPPILIRIFINPVDGDDYEAFGDCYQHFQFRGNYIIALWLDADEYDEPDDYYRIHSILRKAFKHYRAHNYIEQYTPPPGPIETDRYKLEATKDGTGWVCADKKNLYVTIWQHKKFNTTQKIELLEDFEKLNVMYLARWGNEMSGWLSKNHPDKVF